MSLLMDALKRAEKARQAEADRAKIAGRDTPDSGLSLHPLDDEQAAPAPREPRPVGSDTEDSLELTPAEVRREIESMAVDADLDDLNERSGEHQPGAPARRDDDPSLSLSLDYGEIPLDETGATLPSMRAAQRSVQDYFDGTHSMSMSMEDVNTALEAERAQAGAAPRSASDSLDGDTTSRRRAQAVLDARAIAPSGTGRTVALLLLVLIALGLGGAGWMYKDHFIALIDGRSSVLVQRPPPLAKQAPEPAPPAIAAASESPDPSGVLAAAERDALLRAAEVARAEERTLAEAAAAAQQTMQAQAQAAAAASAASEPAPAPALERASSGSDPTPAVAEPGRPARPATAELPAVALADVLGNDAGRGGALPPTPSLRIARRSAPGRTHADLMQAFEAFQLGDDGAAMSAYQRILARQPRNRDALLGAAAVHMRGQAYEQAAAHYLEVLRSHPRDPVAQAALISLQENIDPVAGETRIKTLLGASPEDPNLHFALGNLYAQQGRWPEAQQSYFAAYERDPRNPDYAFNLAVSLDRLAQRAAAREYYARAGELAATQPAAFDPQQARARLAVLSSH